MYRNIAHKIMGFNRKRKYNFFIQELNPNSFSKILDIGYSDNEYSPFDNFLEKNYPYLSNITALGIETSNNFKKNYPDVQVIQFEGRNFPFKDKEFDIGWTNAVIEHVGDYKAQSLFLKEIKRTCKVAFITTPNKYFPIELHTRIPLLHFLPKKYFDKFLHLIGKNWAANNYMNLLTKKQLKLLLSQSGIEEYRIIRNLMVGFTMDFIIIF